MLPAEALGLLRSHVFALMSAGAGHVEMSDLADVLAQTGLSSSWMRNALRQLCDEGVLREPRPGERGVWRVVQRERMPAAAGSRP
jgi:DNA-binding transcriptional regulator PaaX